MQKPIVSILLPSLLIGGAEKSLVQLANGLSGEGWQVHLLVMSAEGPLRADVAPEVELVDLQCVSYRRVVVALAHYYKKRRPRVVLASLYATGMAAVVARWLSNHKPKVIVGAHNSLRGKSDHPDNVKDRFLLMPLSRLLFPRADGIVAVSKGLAEELRHLLRLPAQRIRTIYNPVVTRELLAKASEPVTHPWLVERSKREFSTLVSVGRLVEQKGYDVLLDALSLVRREVDCRLIIVGGGPLKASLEARALRLGIADATDLVGWDDNPHRFVSRANLFVLSSRWEGLANVLIEALACGCPVVATNCRYGPEEILEGGKYGQIASVGDAVDLASKMLFALNVRAEGPSVAVLKARAQDFTVEASVAQYSKYFSEVCRPAADR